MPRKAIEIDVSELQKQIDVIESNFKFKNLSQMINTLCETNWAKDNNLSYPIIYLRITQNNLRFKTQKSKKGRKSRLEAMSQLTETTKELKTIEKVKEVKIIEEEVKQPIKKKNIFGLSVIITPSGNVPYKLENFDNDSIYEWIQDVREYGKKKNVYYTAEAIVYFLRQILDPFDIKFKIVKESVLRLAE